MNNPVFLKTMENSENIRALNLKQQKKVETFLSNLNYHTTKFSSNSNSNGEKTIIHE